MVTLRYARNDEHTHDILPCFSVDSVAKVFYNRKNKAGIRRLKLILFLL